MSTYRKTCRIRFQHCDPAGIVFYPRYYELINALVEDYFEDVLGLSHGAICASGHGIPMRHMEINFNRPSYLGEDVTLSLTPLHVGATSLKFGLEIRSSTGENRVAGDFVIVFIDNIKKKPVKVPKDVVHTINATMNSHDMALEQQLSGEEC